MKRKAYHHGNLREALLEAAQDLLRTNGVDGLSLRKVAQGAGVSATAPYGHFRDKGELLAVMAARGFETLAAGMEAEARQAESESGDVMICLARGYVSFATQQPALFQLMFGPGAGELRDYPELLEASNRAFAIMEHHVAARMRELGDPQMTAAATAGAWSLVHGLSTLLNDGRMQPGDAGVDSNEELIEQVCGLMRFARPT